MTWPSGDGEMARRIRDHDWSATTLGPVEAWPSPLRAAIDLILPAATPIGLYWGADLALVFNDAWRRLVGAKHEVALGRPAREVFPEIWPEIGPMLAGVLAGQGAAQVRDRRLPLDRAGRIEDAWFSFSFDPILLADGSVGGVLNIATETTGRILTDRRREEAERALRDSEERLRMAVELVPAILWWCDAEGNNTAINHRWRSYTGQDRAALQNDGWLDAIHPDDVEATRAAFAHAYATGTPVERQQRIRRTDGAHRWHLVRQVPIRGLDGAITHWFGAAIDIQDLRVLQERQQALVAELQHRTRNLLGVLRALADKIMARSTDLADFSARFGDRLAALARVQDLLSRLAEGERVTFDELLRIELAALNGGAGRVTLDGPTGVSLRSSTVQAFALALHELATNAIKYGAFSQPDGRLDIRWRLARRPEPWLHVDWRERHVAMPAGPRENGSGRELIERVLPYQLGAETTYALRADGVHCTMALPVSTQQAAGGTAPG
ncbi:PAS domain S-box protein [Methylobacterium sp. 17Sr1-1]|uniref:sensor histidine kinase n=1 Tax=Methylobacterium sp. 17Sr1-1 TaxID=2202826 RepID=UPI000D6ED6C8|nr:PAS domain S-box protein [Methylobacterium sp. 17Sr1-1]AWN54310.1 histidine kinase [Methylobacterium sp. 17Sr1-1]